MQKAVTLTSNMEDYLEAISLIKEKNKVARVKDISRMLGVETPSVTSALGTLSRNGLVIHERYGYVDLTPAGESLALDIRKRHEALRRFLSEILLIDPVIAAEDACKMEHNLSPDTFKRLTDFLRFVETCPTKGRPDWLKSFEHFTKTGRRKKCKVQALKHKVPGEK
jgi:DtxR family Mn-dependent transcriptional regulator